MSETVETVEDVVDSIESLLESAADYGKTSYDLVKLKTIYRTSDVVSSLIPHAVVFLILMSFLLFLSLGLASYLGDILGNTLYGYLAVAAFYGFAALVVHFFMHNRIKRKVSDFIIKQTLK